MFKKLRISEFVLYCVSLVIFLGGLALVILGIVADWHDYSQNAINVLLNAQNTWVQKIGVNLTFRVMGFIIIFIAVLMAAITLAVNANYRDRLKEKESRRQLRKQKMDEALRDDSEVAPKVVLEVNEEEAVGDTYVEPTSGEQPQE